jgi:hypothetical protein
VSSVIASYRESTNKLLEVRKHAGVIIVFDSTAHDRGYRVVADFTNGELAKAAQTVPDWAAKVFGKELNPAKQSPRPGRKR